MQQQPTPPGSPSPGKPKVLLVPCCSQEVARYLDQPNSQILQQAASYRIGGYRRLNEKDPAEIKAQLAARYPVLISIPLDETFAHHVTLRDLDPYLR